MDPGQASSQYFQEISNQEYEHFVKPTRRGPVDVRYVENKMNNVSSQKYQYYDGRSAIIGAPYEQNGARNKSYTSLSFVSNSVFYELGNNLSCVKDDMYTTTNKLEQSKSAERLKENRGIEHMGNPFQKKVAAYKPRTKVRTNMTTMENELGTHINKIYKEKLGMPSTSGVQSINSE
jgi:hypothetical protein